MVLFVLLPTYTNLDDNVIDWEKGDILRGPGDKGDSHCSHSGTLNCRMERNLAHLFHRCGSLAGAEALGMSIISGFKKRRELVASGAPAKSTVMRRRYEAVSVETEKWLGSLRCAGLKAACVDYVDPKQLENSV